MPNSPPIIPKPSRVFEIARLELSRIPPETSLDQVFKIATEISSKTLHVARVGIWLFVENRKALRCSNLYELEKEEHSSGTMIRVADFPNYFKALVIRKAIPAEIATKEPWTSELAESYLKPLGITSMLDAGIFVDGVLVGVVCHEHVGSLKEWSTEARDFAGSVADLLAARIQSAQMRELRAAFFSQKEKDSSAEKTAAYDQLAAGMSHDFRNLLTIFLGNGELILGQPNQTADTKKYAQQIVHAAERGMMLTQELMEFARPSTKPPIVADLGVLTNDLLVTLQAKASPKHTISCNTKPPIGHVLVEPSQYHRIVVNLVVNAIEATPHGGRIDLKLSPIRLTGNPIYSGCYVLLEVTDHGIGMDEETIKRVFEPFFSTKKRGTGLGLAIVNQIVTHLGGFIRIESELGKGTNFRVFFPRVGASRGDTQVMAVPLELRGDHSAS